MFGIKSIELIKELKRCDADGKGFLSSYNDKVLQEVFEEMQDLFEENKQDVTTMAADEDRDELFTAVKMRHYGMIRNQRCVMAYLINRLNYIKSLRWGFGMDIPQQIRKNMSENEAKWLESYNQMLYTYMKNASPSADGSIDLCQDQDPPKYRFITVYLTTNEGSYTTRNNRPKTALIKINKVHLYQGRLDQGSLLLRNHNQRYGWPSPEGFKPLEGTEQ